MHPVLVEVGDFTVHSFGVMLALAFIVAAVVARWQFKKRGVKPEFVYGLVVAAVIGGLMGAKVHYLIIHTEEWPKNMLSGSGLVWYGGMFGAIFAVMLVTAFSSQRMGAVMDGGAVALPVGYAVGRIGCFLNGDDYGTPTDLPWGMAFPEGSPPTMVEVHPTQLYESAASLLIFALLVWVIGPRFKREGALMFVYAGLAGIERFLVEFVRTNPVAAFGLTQQQWISIMLVIVGIAGTWWFGTRGRLRPVATAGSSADGSGLVSISVSERGEGGSDDDD
ncbi:MAG: prolipoprotein diacylglyceryl transferase [Thermoleophilia bacterium]|nr:prolipoprotein diacylglyceryl transferase [Thermoleophilia bacterium]